MSGHLTNSTSGYPWPLDTVKSPGFFKPREAHIKAQRSFFLFLDLLFLKSPPWNPLLVDLITTTLFLLKFFFSPGVRVVHRSQFQATSVLWSKASNLHYSLMRLPPPPLPPSPAKHTQLSYVRLRHNHGGAGPGLVGLLWRTRPGTPIAGPVGWNLGVWECRAEPGRPFVTDPSSVIDERNLYLCYSNRYLLSLTCFILLQFYLFIKEIQKGKKPHQIPTKEFLWEKKLCQSGQINIEKN